MKPLYREAPLDERARAYLSQIESPRTRETVGNALKAFYSFRLYHSPVPLAWKKMEVDVLADFTRWLREHGYQEQSQRTYVACATEYLVYALDKGWLSPGFSLERAFYRKKKARARSQYPLVKPSDRVPELIGYYDRQPLPERVGETPLELKRAQVKYLCLLRNRAILHTLFSTAARASEVVSLQRQSVQDGRVNEAAIKGKGNKERYVFLTPKAQAAIQAYCVARADQHPALFISHGRSNGHRLSRHMLWKIVTDAAKALGMDCHPHEIRHYRASQMLNEGVPVEAIARILGHESVSTTLKVYAHFTQKTLREIFDKVSGG